MDSIYECQIVILACTFSILKNLILLAMLIAIAIISKPVIADSANDENTQTNTSGSNTNITGGYESTTTTTYEDGGNKYYNININHNEQFNWLRYSR